MLLADRVSVARRFQRAVRIDTDLGDLTSLEGFVCTQSSATVLETMARHVAETRQGAFTWTGPYGSGKSSLVVALASLLGGDSLMRWNAREAVGAETSDAVWRAMPRHPNGWHILPVVGRRAAPEQLVGEAIDAQRLMKRRRKLWTESQALDALCEIASRDPDSRGGLILFIDEMGKLLEGAARDGSDVYFLQQVAELASRSDGRLIIVGILHQAFEEYSYRLSREMREEWAKIQGRFIDLAVNTAADEQIALLGQAIQKDHRPSEPSSLSVSVADLTHRATSPDLPQLLEDCWPLHPVVACLLGPISRRRFGQNQRSLFGFLNSTEPCGFQDFVRRHRDDELYPPEALWDYLRLNLEPSIMASPDGHRWALAVDALERCQALGGQELHLRVLQTIALVDLFKERSGLVPSADVLTCSLPDIGVETLDRALAQLQEWSLVVYRKFSDSYSIFEGSDFDLDDAVDQALGTMEDVDFGRLNAIADLSPVVAKRHYHETGALRWSDVVIAPLTELEGSLDSFRPRQEGMGTFLLAVPTQGESITSAQDIVREAISSVRDWDLVVGLPQEAWTATSLARELLATEQVRDESPALQGDRVARREVEARHSALQDRIEGELTRAFDEALWHSSSGDPRYLTQAQLNGLASDLADCRFSAAPRLHNELLNRVKPSSNAVAAQNALLRRMAQHEGGERLGIEGFPAEGGLFASLLLSSGLYLETATGWRFVAPACGGNDPCNLAPTWTAATQLLESNRHRTVSISEVYEVWREQPFGIKDGLLPILGTAFILSLRREVAFYRQNVFQARVTDLDVDYLAKDPRDVQLRWMDLSQGSRDLLSDMAGIVRRLDPDNALADLEPIDVAKGLVAISDRLPAWTGRTQRLSSNAKQVRHLFKRASDPNSLIFDEIPQVLSNGMGPSQEDAFETISQNVQEGLLELQQAYPAMLHRLRETLLSELQVPNASPPMLAELRARAQNVRDLSGDHRMEAFIMRLAHFGGTDADMESLASMVANKPSQTWVDADIDGATVELADMAQKFLRIESYAHVKGRPDKRHAMAMTVGLSGRPSTVHYEFDVTSMDGARIEAVVCRIEEALQDTCEERRDIVLAALAELSALYLEAGGGSPMAYSKSLEALS